VESPLCTFGDPVGGGVDGAVGPLGSTLVRRGPGGLPPFCCLPGGGPRFGFAVRVGEGPPFGF